MTCPSPTACPSISVVLFVLYHIAANWAGSAAVTSQDSQRISSGVLCGVLGAIL